MLEMPPHCASTISRLPGGLKYYPICPAENTLDMVIMIFGIMNTSHLLIICAAVPAFHAVRAGILDSPLKVTEGHYHLEEIGH
jgi:hypothetical protein